MKLEEEIIKMSPSPPSYIYICKFIKYKKSLNKIIHGKVRIIDIVQAELDEGLEDEIMEDEILPQSETTIPETNEDGFPLC